MSLITQYWNGCICQHNVYMLLLYLQQHSTHMVQTQCILHACKGGLLGFDWDEVGVTEVGVTQRGAAFHHALANHM